MAKQTVEMLDPVKFAFFGQMRTKDMAMIRKHSEFLEWIENIISRGQNATSSKWGYSQMFTTQQAAYQFLLGLLSWERQRANPS